MLFATLALFACNGPEGEIRQLYPTMVVSPAEYDFGEVVVDYTAEATIEVVNAGRADLKVTSIEFQEGGAGVFAIEPAEFVLDHDDQDSANRLELTLSFTPSTYLQYADTLVFHTNDPDAETFLFPVVGLGGDGPTPDIHLDELAIDFGEVIPPDNETIGLELKNVGDGPLTILSTTQAGSGDFSFPFDPTGEIIAPGGSFPLVLTYDPPIPGAPDEEIGDNGTFTITSDDPDEPEVVITILANGGGTFEYPVAVLDCPDDPSPPDTFLMDGSASYDPYGYAITDYEWELVEIPSGSTGWLEETSDPAADIYMDIAGIYEVRLSVVNEFDVRSAPAVCRMDAVPVDNIHVELLWDTSRADLDLHMLESPDAELWDAPHDVCYCNKTPDWGVPLETSDDPRLDIDDIAGHGPENINITTPADGEYPVRVHFFDDNGDGAVTATVRFYLNGLLTDTYARVLDNDEVWEVGTIRWPEAVVIEEDDEPYFPSETGRQCF